jgi:glycopeptide antibiotics resistance protein
MRYLLDVGVVLTIYIIWIYPRFKKLDSQQFVINNLMVIYLVFVSYFTLMPVLVNLPFVFIDSYETMNFVPFIDLQLGRPLAQKEIILNIIMLVPFGVLLPLIKKQNILYVVSKAFLLSLSIELLQPFISSSRAFDVTDIITNTTGALIGYLLYIIFKKPLQAMIKILAKLF